MGYLRQKSILDFFLELKNDPDRKSFFRIIADLFILFFRYKEIPVHYFSRYLFKKDRTNIKDYLPNKFLAGIARQFNDKKVKAVLDDKLYFSLFFSQFDLSMPKILMYNHHSHFIVGNKSFTISNRNDFVAKLNEVLDGEPFCEALVIKKTYASSSGHKIFKLFKSQLSDESPLVSEIYSEVTKSDFLFQECVKQHPVLNKLNSSSLNTIRFDTFIDKDGRIDIISGYIRMSIRNLHIDNISSGGCQVGIVLEDGKLKKNGYALIQSTGIEVFTEHPVTHILFENFTIPFFNEAKELTIQAARLNPGMRLIGWDIAIGESGPVLIEGNSDYDMSGNDLAAEGYFANPVFRKVLHEINYL
jgi:hypothetical protein